MVSHYSQEDFYKLPDWEKLKLKRSRSKYRGYRMMTQDQESNRKEVIYDICAHFGMTTVENLEEDAFVTMENFWPTKIEFFVTPKTLDYFPAQFLCKYGYCSYCIHYEGYAKNNKLKSNIIPFKGICTKDGNKDIVPHDARCYSWELGTFHIQLMYVMIEKVLDNNSNYNFDEFIADLENFNFWNYFFYIK
jgi:hypothetical protein